MGKKLSKFNHTLSHKKYEDNITTINTICVLENNNKYSTNQEINGKSLVLFNLKNIYIYVVAQTFCSIL